MPKRIYLDVCAYCRPFDDQDQVRIRLETDAYYLILSRINEKFYRTVITPVHFAEVNDISDFEERMEILALLRKLKSPVSYNAAEIRKRAEYLYSLKFGVADAAHLAFAEALADEFISCDDKLTRKCKREDIKIPVFSLVEFVSREDLK